MSIENLNTLVRFLTEKVDTLERRVKQLENQSNNPVTVQQPNGFPPTPFTRSPETVKKAVCSNCFMIWDELNSSNGCLRCGSRSHTLKEFHATSI